MVGDFVYIIKNLYFILFLLSEIKKNKYSRFSLTQLIVSYCNKRFFVRTKKLINIVT